MDDKTRDKISEGCSTWFWIAVAVFVGTVVAEALK